MGVYVKQGEFVVAVLGSRFFVEKLRGIYEYTLS